MDFKYEQRNRLADIFDLISNHNVAENNEMLEEFHGLVQDNVELLADRLVWTHKTVEDAFVVGNLQACLRHYRSKDEKRWHPFLASNAGCFNSAQRDRLGDMLRPIMKHKADEE